MQVKSKKNTITLWEVSILQFKDDFGIKYKVTRRLPEMLVAETIIFNSKKEARELFDEWLK